MDQDGGEIRVELGEGLEWSDCPLTEDRVVEALAAFADTLGLAGRGVGLLLAGDGELRGLNRDHRGKDKPTDVLSWSYYEDDPDSPELGDLAVSLDRCREQAAENGWDAGVELLRLLAHGVAHLAGHDHERGEEEERIMLKIEVEMLGRVGLGAIYPSAD